MRRRFWPLGQMPSTSELLVASGAIRFVETGQLAGIAGSVALVPLASHQLSSSFQGPTSVMSTFATLRVPSADAPLTVQCVVPPVRPWYGWELAGSEGRGPPVANLREATGLARHRGPLGLDPPD